VRPVILAAVVYLVLTATLLAPVDAQGARVTEITIDSRAVGRELDVKVVRAAKLVPRGERALLVFLHGRGGDEDTFTGNEAFFEGLRRLGRRAPLVAFPDGGESSYWHNRDEGRWGRYVMREVIPRVSRRFGVDPRQIAVGGISMGGFGAYHLALKHPRRFCAVGGHSAALWLAAGETAPGAFDDAADFRRNDVIGTVHRDPDAFGSMRVWNDYGRSDPFRPYNETFVAALRRGDADLSAHVWPGGHEGAYWTRHWPRYLRFYANSLAHCG
jgi:poly(3-hydroxybutyrate) depolymerase